MPIPIPKVNTTLEPTLFDYGAPGYQNLTLSYGCASSLLPLHGQFSCPTSGDVQVELGAHGPNEECNVSVVALVLLNHTLTDRSSCFVGFRASH
jgi:hypothetical protein